ncbi:HNH endonuclease (plasmid) [Methylomarinum sp. Ch1-1]|uniref:HNH endonuclease n=1 Tax=Methylomarinum roseum TaxID=3067653 RepID=A0AAU7P0L1_9GAMM|nr:HNH endonuclease [Methylomarinum sp. Ch1-1]MDP4518992.1 HNH endonuclease domain-containing protein [Methylomarinum sp. Ch1-1]MDP4523390.1 HNH endonuclease domain-containing protein [Methylomarinum sp. Ch1-1]
MTPSADQQLKFLHLQNIGGAQIPFLYQYPHPRGKLILHDGVASMLRTFHPLIQQLSRAGWIAHVRKNKRNAEIIGQVDELEMFMFGSSRASLNQAAYVLRKLQSDKCFYCSSNLPKEADVDHFIPWSKYPRDLAHNFVLAHASCNRKKSDMLAAQHHLENWLSRNQRYGTDLKLRTDGVLS